MILCSLTSWSYIYFSCHIGKCRQTSKQCLNIIKKSDISSFPDVLVIFALITILGNAHKPCEQYPNIVSNCLQHAYSFLLIIPDFLIRFTLLTILGNAHRPCKQYTNIVDNGLHHISLFFPDFLSDFLGIFTLITILGNAHRPCKLYLNIINNFTSCLSFFS